MVYNQVNKILYQVLLKQNLGINHFVFCFYLVKRNLFRIQANF